MSQVTVVDSWQGLSRKLHQLEGRCAWACRGESRPFSKVSPSLDRITKRWRGDLAGRCVLEQVLLRRFMDQGALHLGPADVVQQRLLADPATALVLMRHFGGPTRLVDWSQSAWIAAYFACRDEPRKDGVIRYFDRYQLTENAHNRFGKQTEMMWKAPHGVINLFFPTWVDEADHWVVCFHLAGITFPRISAQQGFFTLASKPFRDHWSAVEDMLRNRRGEGWGTIRIAASAKPGVLQGLSRMGITGATLAPGLDGLGQSLSDFASYGHIDVGLLELLNRPWRKNGWSPRRKPPASTIFRGS